MSMKYSSIRFLPTGKEVRVPEGTSLWKAASDADVWVDSICGGKGVCGKCRARVLEGDAGMPSDAEKKFLSRENIEEGRILLCQRVVLGDLLIEVEPAAEESADFVASKGDFPSFTLEPDPYVTKTYHELSPPTLHDQAADLERVLSKLPCETWVDAGLLHEVPGALRESHFRVTSVVFGHELVSLERGDTSSEAYGVAVDIGTTTVAGYLVDLLKGNILASASATNRQGIHGADVVSRMAYTAANSEGLADMQGLVAQTIDEIIMRLLDRAHVVPDRVYELAFVGNTVMSHLLLGVSPSGIASPPFVPVFSGTLRGPVRTLGLKSIPSHARFIVLPHIAGYVGADTTGVILATRVYELPGTWLAIDIGTNGEIVLSSNERLLTCSTAAGPAFEGGCIDQGMRAVPGAIYKVEIDSDVHSSVIGSGEARGICGSGLIDAVWEMVRLGIIRDTGRIRGPMDCPPDLPPQVRNRIRPAGKSYEFVLAEGKQRVTLTQKDVSELQLAKGAIRAGVDILLEEMGVTPSHLDGILLAGAFGSSLRPHSVKGIGLLPDIPIDRIKSVGNAAGMGAILALLSRKQLELASVWAAKAEHIELSVHKGFPHKFVNALNFKEKAL